MSLLSFTLTSFLVSGIVLLILTRSLKSKRVKLPPGPPGWPVVGNLFQFVRSGKQFYEYVDDLRKKYGSIFTLRMGSRTMIVISDSVLAHEALIKQGPIFATRSKENPTRNIFTCNAFTVNSGVYGPVWRSLRRNMVQNLMTSTRLREFGWVRQSAMDKLAERIKAEADNNNGLVWVLSNARYAAFCIMLEMCFGIEMDEDTILKMDQMMTKVLTIIEPRLDEYLPILAPFYSKERKKALEVRREQVDFFVGFIERRRIAIQNPGSDYKTYLDTLFDLQIEGRKSTLSNEELVALCSELLHAGTDTTGTAIEWAIAQIITIPVFQSRLYDEIKSTVGDRAVEEKDVDKMVFLQAFVKEILRKHPPSYFTLPHSVTEPTTIAGYDIPAGVNVDFYIPGINEDLNIWSDPMKFNPDRFISGKEDVDITGVKGVKMMPFGVGRRICPGISMATVHMYLMIAKMVQKFEWSAYPAGSEIDLTGKLDFTVVMKKPLRAMVKPRV